MRDDPRVHLANQENLTNALRVALLILPEQFTLETLFLTIAGLSYHGTLFFAVNDRHSVVRCVDAPV